MGSDGPMWETDEKELEVREMFDIQVKELGL